MIFLIKSPEVIYSKLQKTDNIKTTVYHKNLAEKKDIIKKEIDYQKVQKFRFMLCKN
jgi:hypothetical protein